MSCHSEPLGQLKIFAAGDGELRAKFQIEIADDASERSLGLMYRKKMDANRGMFFIFPQEVSGPFWMKNTLIPLDILFINPHKRIVSLVAGAEPQTTTPRRSSAPYLYVLEIKGGLAAELGITVGDRVEFTLP